MFFKGFFLDQMLTYNVTNKTKSQRTYNLYLKIEDES